MNDPFELSPRIDEHQFTLSRTKKLLRQDPHIDEAYRIDGPRLGITNKKRFKDHYLKNLDAKVSTLLPKISSNVAQLRVDFAAIFSEHWRLFCASRVPNSILMWSHYSKDHTGMVIEFDTDQPLFNALGQEFILDVQYSTKKAAFVYHPKTGGFQHGLIDVVRTKAIEWKYEGEVRMMFPSNRYPDFAPFDPKAVRSVTLGCRCSPEYQTDVENILNDVAYDHVSIFRYELSMENYALEEKLVRAKKQLGEDGIRVIRS